MATIQVRTDGKMKKRVQKILKRMGLDMSTAIKLYFQKIILTESIPFPIRTINGFTPEQEQEILREERESLKHGKKYHSIDELFKEWDAE